MPLPFNTLRVSIPAKSYDCKYFGRYPAGNKTAPVLSSNTTLATALTGRANPYQMSFTGGIAPGTYSCQVLQGDPAEFSINPTSGVLTMTPDTPIALDDGNGNIFTEDNGFALTT